VTEKKMQTDSYTNQRPTLARFSLGQNLHFARSRRSSDDRRITGIEFLRRHVSGDLGELPDDDWSENELLITRGFALSGFIADSGIPIAQ
jgi:hypothetical protein